MASKREKIVKRLQEALESRIGGKVHIGYVHASKIVDYPYTIINETSLEPVYDESNQVSWHLHLEIDTHVYDRTDVHGAVDDMQHQIDEAILDLNRTKSADMILQNADVVYMGSIEDVDPPMGIIYARIVIVYLEML